MGLNFYLADVALSTPVRHSTIKSINKSSFADMPRLTVKMMDMQVVRPACLPFMYCESLPFSGERSVIVSCRFQFRVKLEAVSEGDDFFVFYLIFESMNALKYSFSVHHSPTHSG